MGFKQFLAEAKHTKFTLDETIEKIKKDCKPFLKHKVALYRGMGPEYGLLGGIRGVRFDRKPLTSSQEFADFMSDYLYNIGAPDRSQAMFCTRQETSTWDYGEPYLVFPKGNFRYFYFEHIEDAYTEIQSALDGNSVYQPRMVDAQWDIGWSYDTMDVVGQVHWYFNKTKNLDKAIDAYFDELTKDIKELEESESEDEILSDLDTAYTAIKRVFNKLEFYNVNKNLNKADDQEIVVQCKEYYYLSLENLPKDTFKELGIKE